jgi:HEPN domain-containing protein
MADPELIKKWMQKADEDFGYASLSLQEEFTFFPQIYWHFQQAAEKYLKAYSLRCGKIYHRVVNLAEIAELSLKSNKKVF